MGQELQNADQPGSAKRKPPGFWRGGSRRRAGSQLRVRVRAVFDAIRLIQECPKLSPVEGISLTGLELRRSRANQFVVVYSYFEPSPADPDGLVSVRAIRHGSEEDVLFGVEEPRAGGQRERSSPLILR